MKRRVPHRIDVPATRIHPNDLKVMENVLMAYLDWVRRSSKRDTRIGIMQGLQRRLRMLLSSSHNIDGICVLFTDQELRAMKEALSGYMHLLCQIIPPSPQRDEVLEGLQGLYQQVAAMLAPHLS